MPDPNAFCLEFSTGETAPFRAFRYGFVLRGTTFLFGEFTVIQGNIKVHVTHPHQAAMLDFTGINEPMFAIARFPIPSFFESGFTMGPGAVTLHIGKHTIVECYYFITEFIDGVIDGYTQFMAYMQSILVQTPIQQIESALNRTPLPPVSEWGRVNTTLPIIATRTLNTLTIPQARQVAHEDIPITAAALMSPDGAAILSAQLIYSPNEGKGAVQIALFEPVSFTNHSAKLVKIFPTEFSPPETKFGFVKYWPKKIETNDLNIINGSTFFDFNVQVYAAGRDIYALWNLEGVLDPGSIPFEFIYGDLQSIVPHLKNPSGEERLPQC